MSGTIVTPGTPTIQSLTQPAPGRLVLTPTAGSPIVYATTGDILTPAAQQSLEAIIADVLGPQIPTPVPATIAVGPKRQFTQVADAMAQAQPGGTIVLDDGVYQQGFDVTVDGLTVKSASGNPFRCYFDGRGGIGGGHRLLLGKAILHTSKNLSVYGIGFRNAGSVASGADYTNEAGIWIGDNGGTKTWTVTIMRCAFDNCANGVFTSPEPRLTVNLFDCIYGWLAPNGVNSSAGLGGGGSAGHDNYIAADTLNVHGSYFYGCCAGHNVKSRCRGTNIHDNLCMTQDGGRAADVPDGGTLIFRNNTVYARKDRTKLLASGIGAVMNTLRPGCFGNANLLAYAGESTKFGVGGGTLSGNTLHISRGSSVIWANAGTITSVGDTVHYYEDGSLTLQGVVSGLAAGSATAGAPAAPALPPPPSWAVV